jgi:hypothetical protein
MFNLEIRPERPKTSSSLSSMTLSIIPPQPAVPQLPAMPPLPAIPPLPAVPQLPAMPSLRAVPHEPGVTQLPAVSQLPAVPQLFSAAVAATAPPLHTLPLSTHTPSRHAGISKKRPGPRRQPISAAPRWIPPAAATPSRAKRARTTEFKLGVLAWAHHTRLEDGKGGLRQPTREEVRKRFGLKSINQISKWKRVS